VKANRAQVEKALKAPAGTRFFLLYGPDDSGSRALARLTGAAMGAEAERPTRRQASPCSAAPAGSWSIRPATNACPRSRRCWRHRRREIR
jgi:hypothetical protein